MKKWEPVDNDVFYHILYDDDGNLVACERWYWPAVHDKMKFPLGLYRTKKEAQTIIKKIKKLVWG
jgi:hypothetical protein